jgi:hypothetical protein
VVSRVMELKNSDSLPSLILHFCHFWSSILFWIILPFFSIFQYPIFCLLILFATFHLEDWFLCGTHWPSIQF